MTWLVEFDQDVDIARPTVFTARGRAEQRKGSDRPPLSKTGTGRAQHHQNFIPLAHAAIVARREWIVRRAVRFVGATLPLAGGKA